MLELWSVRKPGSPSHFALIEASNQGGGFHLPQGVLVSRQTFPTPSWPCIQNAEGTVLITGWNARLDVIKDVPPSRAMWKIQSRFLGEGRINSFSALSTAVNTSPFTLCFKLQCQTKKL